jgi:ATP-dependent protease HslVU (ClpYQ) peptidase subunit
MSNTLPQTHPSVGQLHWRGLAALAALLLVAAALSVYIVASRDDAPSPAPAVHSIGSSGPNETARGQAAASAAGAEPVRSGGPDETARGIAASQASR